MNAIQNRRSLGAALAVLVGLILPTVLSGQDRPLVVIDPGHGGDQPGVIHGDVVEKDVILVLAFNMAAELVRHGFDVRLTRTGDYDVPWDERRAMAERAEADLLLMLHAMGKEDESIHGAEVYFYEEDARSSGAARLVAEALEDDGTEVQVLARPWPFLQSPTVPTVMIELGHLSNALERRALFSDDYHRHLARSMIRVAETLVPDAR